MGLFPILSNRLSFFLARRCSPALWHGTDQTHCKNSCNSLTATYSLLRCPIRKVVLTHSSTAPSKSITMRQRHGLSNWYCALCICALGLALDHVAWAQVPNETYDFNITKGIVEFGRGH